MGAIENILGLMTIGLARVASRAFEPNTLEIPKAGFSRIRGSNPWIAGTMAVPSDIDDEAGSTTAGNARTRGVNPSMADGACPLLESDEICFRLNRFRV